jgi:hypothetical protein
VRAPEPFRLRLLRRLLTNLRLRVNEAKSAVDWARNRKLLGYCLWIGPGGVIKRRVAPQALKAMKDRVREITRRSRSQSIERVAQDLRSYLDHAPARCSVIGSTFAKCSKSSSLVKIEYSLRVAIAQIKKSVLEPWMPFCRHLLKCCAASS